MTPVPALSPAVQSALPVCAKTTSGCGCHRDWAEVSPIDAPAPQRPALPPRRRRSAGWWIAILLAVGLPACGSSGASRDDLADFVLVFLESGPRDARLSDDEIEQARDGHLASMRRLAAADLLLSAGPLGDAPAESAYRGVLVLDVPDVGQAEELTAADPAVRNGALRCTAYPWRANASLRRLPGLERRTVARNSTDIRPYVLVTAGSATAEPVLRVLRSKRKLVFSGSLGGELRGRVLFAIDARSIAEARQLIGERPQPDGWVFYPWYSSASLQRLIHGGR